MLGTLIVLCVVACVVRWYRMEERWRAECHTRCRSDAMLKQVAEQVEMFYVDYNRYPRSLEDLAAATPPPYIEGGDWHPFLTELPQDGWRRPFVYRAGNDGYALLSLGRDGRVGGQGPDADLEVRGHPWR